MNETVQNILICLLFLVSGLVIFRALNRFRVSKWVKTLFGIVFGILLLYIPFYFGGYALSKAISATLPQESVSLIFMQMTYSTLSTPFIFMKSISLIAAIVALFSGIATIVLFIRLGVMVIDYIKQKKHRQAKKCVEKRIYSTYCYRPNYRNTYLRFQRLRN